jgi:hypothetical protein
VLRRGRVRIGHGAGKGFPMNRKAMIILVIIVAVILLVLLIIYAVNLASGGGWGRNTAAMNSGNLPAQATMKHGSTTTSAASSPRCAGCLAASAISWTPN